MTKKRIPPFPAEVRERAVRMVLEQQGAHPTQWAAMCSIAGKIGCSGETLHNWVRQAEPGRGLRSGPTSAEGERIRSLERENRELRQANEILRKASAYFCDGGARPPTQAMIAFIDAHRGTYGVEPIARLLPIAPSSYHEHAARGRDPDRAPARQKRDSTLCQEIRRASQADRREAMVDSSGRRNISLTWLQELVETINGLFKAEVIHRQSWRNIETVELATLEWVDWFNHRRILEHIGNIPPAEVEIAYYAALEPMPIAA